MNFLKEITITFFCITAFFTRDRKGRGGNDTAGNISPQRTPRAQRNYGQESFYLSKDSRTEFKGLKYKVSVSSALSVVCL